MIGLKRLDRSASRTSFCSSWETSRTWKTNAKCRKKINVSFKRKTISCSWQRHQRRMETEWTSFS